MGGSIIFIRSSRRVLPTRNSGNCWGSNKGSSKLKAGGGGGVSGLSGAVPVSYSLLLDTLFKIQRTFQKRKTQRKGRRTEAVRCEEREAVVVSEITEELFLTGRAGGAFSPPADPFGRSLPALGAQQLCGQSKIQDDKWACGVLGSFSADTPKGTSFCPCGSHFTSLLSPVLHSLETVSETEWAGGVVLNF